MCIRDRNHPDHLARERVAAVGAIERNRAAGDIFTKLDVVRDGDHFGRGKLKVDRVQFSVFGCLKSNS